MARTPKESVDFHIQSGDYFGTLATVLDLLRQDTEWGEKKAHSKLLEQLRDDLLYLHSSHEIKPKKG